MKYLTKEWYIAWRRAGISRGLRPDPLAEQFSEAHYKKVYDEELRRYIASFEPLDISTIKKYMKRNSNRQRKFFLRRSGRNTMMQCLRGR